MSIQKDAGEILAFIYKKYTEGGQLSISTASIVAEAKWDPERIERAMDYLEDRGMVKLMRAFGGSFMVEKIYPDGIDTIENKEQFLSTFGFEINLGLFKFSWQKQEK